MAERAVLALAFGLATVLGGAAPAQQGFADFSAKRVTPPAADATRRITVQIAPRAEPAVPPRPHRAAPVAAAPKQPAPATRSGARYGWFWQAISPSLSESGPGRLAPALRSLSDGPAGEAVPAPRLQALQAIASSHGPAILRATAGTEVSPALALAVIAVESSGQSEALSRAGAQGLMQLMPATARQFGVSDAFDPAQNIAGGVRFLDHLMTRFDGDPILTLASYNAGEKAVATHSGVPPFDETRDYVPKVLAAFQTARGLCLTPPELVSDGCVFRIMTP